MPETEASEHHLSERSEERARALPTRKQSHSCQFPQAQFTHLADSGSGSAMPWADSITSAVGGISPEALFELTLVPSSTHFTLFGAERVGYRTQSCGELIPRRPRASLTRRTEGRFVK